MSRTQETYKGIAIAITTRPQNGRWISAAVYTSSGKTEVRVEAAENGYETENEARQAALQAAVENIDRARSFIGKP